MSSDVKRDDLKVTIGKLLKAKTKPKDVLKKVKKQHPSAKSKDITLAAFSLMIEVVDKDEDLAKALQEFGLNGRGVR